VLNLSAVDGGGGGLGDVEAIVRQVERVKLGLIKENK
jgi:hypothetical protein